jgi:hypothetical protein
MAYALVGSIGTVASSTGATITPTFAQSTTAGNLLIAWIYNSNGNTPTLSGWTRSHATTTASIMYKPNCAAGESNPAFNVGGGTNFAALGEFSGGATSSPVDQTGSTGNALGNGTTTASAADTAAGELLVACLAAQLSKTGTDTTTFSFNNGATPTSNLNNDASSVIDHYRFAWGITTGNSAADSNTFTHGSMNLIGDNEIIASFLLAAAGPAANPPYVNPMPPLIAQ